VAPPPTVAGHRVATPDHPQLSVEEEESLGEEESLREEGGEEREMEVRNERKGSYTHFICYP